MQDTNTKIAFFGTPKIAQVVLENLVKTKYKPQLVVTPQDSRVGRGQKVTPSAVAQTAQTSNLKIIGRLEDLNESFELAILVAFGFIIPKRILDIPKFGFINIHPSLLPKYRGPSPITSALAAGDKKTGVTLITLDEEVDHGPIIAQKELEIAPNDTNESLTLKLANLGVQLLLDTLPDYLAGKITPQAQNHKGATYAEKITKDSGKIDINNPPDPKTLARLIRAYFPWPTVWTEIEGKRIKLLPEEKIQMESKKPMTILEFSNGYPQIAEKLTKLIEFN